MTMSVTKTIQIARSAAESYALDDELAALKACIESKCAEQEKSK